MARELPKQIKDKQITHEQISQRAYEIFVERGCPEGRDMEHWLEAETQLKAGTASPTLAMTKTTKTPARQTVSRRA